MAEMHEDGAVEHEHSAGIPESTAGGSHEAVFGRLLSLLPNDVKHLLLLEALETCGPACLVGLETARDAILYAAVRHEPALLRSVTSFLGADNDLDGGDNDTPHIATSAPGDDDFEDELQLGDTGAASSLPTRPTPGPPPREAPVHEDTHGEGFELV